MNKSDTVFIILHEIYGVNQHMKSVCGYYSTAGFDVICPDLTQGSQSYAYHQADLAYHSFMEHVGFKKASEQVYLLIKQSRQNYRYVFLLGFSIGATTAWICSDIGDACDGIIGYYGSRIRDYLYVIPKCPVILIYPKAEKAFSVSELADNLKNHPNVEVYLMEGDHGFCDMFAVNYRKESHEKSLHLVEDFITQVKAAQISNF